MNNHEFHFKAPARINLIGEHIDYNGGVVLPSAINLYMNLYINLRNDDKITIKSDNFSDVVKTSLNDLDYNLKYGWSLYVVGVFFILKKHGFNINKGLDLYFKSEIPVASGLSSSAAIEDVTLFSLSSIFNLNLSRMDIVLYAKEVENDYCKLKSGVMDQAIISLAKKDTCMLLNCNTLEYSYYNVDLDNYKFVVLKTNKPRKLIESKYNERVDECQKALKIIKTKYNVNTLAELKVNDLINIEKLLNDNLLFKRVKHVVEENDRVYNFIDALKNKDIKLIGKLLNESHTSLCDLYEVTGFHLDTIVASSIASGAIGARMTGAGFGGCAIALIDENRFDEFKDNVSKLYFEKTNIEPDIYMVSIVDGVNKTN